jgi:hypothetical protein|tara:strand:- start:1452 stop:1883 length:432 start_codon:yes stop_codon:yes gene_type:complete
MKELIESLEDFTWENYKDISDALVQFNEIEVETEMFRQASIYSYYFGLMSFAKRKVGEASVQLTRFMSKLRKEAKRDSSVKLTAKDLDDLVFADDQYTVRQNALDDATFKYEMLKGLVRALEQKKDMLQQSSANKREETKLYK